MTIDSTGEEREKETGNEVILLTGRAFVGVRKTWTTTEWILLQQSNHITRAEGESEVHKQRIYLQTTYR